MSFSFSNILASVGVIFSLIVGFGWVAPRLSSPVRFYFLFSLTWGVFFATGQFSQHDEWGPLWVQYHLQDFSYIPWGTAFGATSYFFLARLLHWKITEYALVVSMIFHFVAALIVGYGGELWDTFWGWQALDSLAQAIDWVDYASFTAGIVITVAPCLLWKLPPRPVTS